MRAVDPTISNATKVMSRGVEAQLQYQQEMELQNAPGAARREFQVRRQVVSIGNRLARLRGASLSLQELEEEQDRVFNFGASQKRPVKQEREREAAREKSKPKRVESGGMAGAVAKLREKFGK